MLTRCVHACGRHVHPLDPRASGNELGTAFYLRAMGPAVVRLVFCPSAQAAQGFHRGSRDCCQRGTSRSNQASRTKHHLATNATQKAEEELPVCHRATTGRNGSGECSSDMPKRYYSQPGRLDRALVRGVLSLQPCFVCGVAVFSYRDFS